MRGTILIVCLLVLGACGETSEPDAAEQSSLACDHFRNVAGDWDIMRDEERARKLREVYDNAAIATNKVRQASRDLLKHYLARNEAKASAAIRRLDRACEDAGH